jgi:DNA-cytosine methyltransferase
MAMRLLDLFSGIGGFSYAAETLIGGYETVAFCEMDEFCQKVLKKHWPQVPIYDDVRTLDAARLGRIDICTFGFPCQPVSQAGVQKGESDDRWLWDEIIRILQVSKPKWIIAENVVGLITIENGLLIENCISSLEAEGYEVQSVVIPACSKNAPHRRSRIWLIGQLTTNTNSNGHERGWSETRNQNTTRQNTQGEWSANTKDIERQGNDEFDFGEPRVDGDLSGSSDRGTTISADTTGVCGLSKDADNNQGTSSQHKYQEDNDRTLVSQGQKGLQLSEHRGLAADQTIAENNTIRSGDDNNSIERMENKKSNVTDSESKGLAHSNEREICISKQSGMDSNEKGNRSKVRSKPTRRNKLSTENVTNTDNERLQGHGEHRQLEREQREKQFAKNSLQNEHRTNRKFEQRMGDMADGISTGLLRHFDREPDHIPRVTKGEKDRSKKLKALGNSIVPQVAAEILLAIRVSEESV